MQCFYTGCFHTQTSKSKTNSLFSSFSANIEVLCRLDYMTYFFLMKVDKLKGILSMQYKIGSHNVETHQYIVNIYEIDNCANYVMVNQSLYARFLFSFILQFATKRYSYCTFWLLLFTENMLYKNQLLLNIIKYAIKHSWNQDVLLTTNMRNKYRSQSLI